MLKVVLPSLGFFQIMLGFLYIDAKFQALVRQTHDSPASHLRKGLQQQRRMHDGGPRMAPFVGKIVLFVNGAISLAYIPKSPRNRYSMCILTCTCGDL